jgi:hypothetical protein
MMTLVARPVLEAIISFIIAVILLACGLIQWLCYGRPMRSSRPNVPPLWPLALVWGVYLLSCISMAVLLVFFFKTHSFSLTHLYVSNMSMTICSTAAVVSKALNIPVWFVLTIPDSGFLVSTLGSLSFQWHSPNPPNFDLRHVWGFHRSGRLWAVRETLGDFLGSTTPRPSHWFYVLLRRVVFPKHER